MSKKKTPAEPIKEQPVTEAPADKTDEKPAAEPKTDQTEPKKDDTEPKKDQVETKEDKTEQSKPEQTDAAPKAKKARKKLTKKQLIIIIAAAVLVAATVITVPLCVTYATPQAKMVKPYFKQFDKLSDSTVVAEWKSVPGAALYHLEYAYGEPTGTNVKAATTTATSYTMDRKKDVTLYFRAKADVSPDFSEWISVEIPALKLRSPEVSIDNSLQIDWTKVGYDYRGVRTDVSQYRLDITAVWAGEKPVNIESSSSGGSYEYLKDFILHAFEYEDGVPGVEWADIYVTVKVKATTEGRFGALLADDAEKFLKEAYIDGDWAIAQFTVTKDIYEGLK